MTTYGMVIDLKKCVGCQACSVSCKGANATPPGDLRCWVDRVEEGTYPEATVTFVPKMCNHCENAPCIEACAVEGATYKREDGIVVIDKEKCIGCKACITTCPYEARHSVEEGVGYFGESLTAFEEAGYGRHPAKTVDKCDFCLSRAAEGAVPEPACASACPAGARLFGDIDTLRSVIDERDGTVLLAEEGTHPVVHYLPNVKY